MTRTIDKILIGLVVVLFLGMGSVLITALEDKAPMEQLRLGDSSFEDSSEDEEETEVPITGSSLQRASAVALDYIGNGRVTETELGDEEGYYEIEITLDNGDQVDVHLDENFNILSTEWEDEEDND